MIKLKTRSSAVLMSVSSLPGPYGIGGFGDEFKKFIDFLKQGGFSGIQVLPFNLPDLGNSPYGSCSAFAGNYLYIDPKGLFKMGLLTEAELKTFEYSGSPYTVNYYYVFKSKRDMLTLAFKRAGNSLDSSILDFYEKNPWVVDYSLYMALKDKYNNIPWQQWEDNHKEYNKAILEINKFKDEVKFYVFEQYLFNIQYNKVKNYANKNHIAVIGDIPIYVAKDSVDVWKNPNLFCLDEDYNPKIVAGVPPDTFSKNGQLWGNPVYDWENHKSNDYSWWISRLERTLDLCDLVRIDHFRGFASYYTVDAKAKNAVFGEWKIGPGMDLFKKIIERFGKDKIIAEDLGVYGADVENLLKQTNIPPMRVIQFGFSGENSIHLPHNYNENCIAYTGTHDNNTLLGWLWELNETDRKTILDYCGFKGNDWSKGGYYSESCRCIIETLWKTPSKLAVIPFQDLCGFGSDARMNIPGTQKDNWRFRTTEEIINQVDIKYFKYINNLYFRV